MRRRKAAACGPVPSAGIGMVDGLETELGGFARMNTLIEAQRAQNPDTLVIDGGDFSMGTLIQTVFETQAAELRMLGYRG